MQLTRLIIIIIVCPILNAEEPNELSLILARGEAGYDDATIDTYESWCQERGSEFDCLQEPTIKAILRILSLAIRLVFPRIDPVLFALFCASLVCTIACLFRLFVLIFRSHLALSVYLPAFTYRANAHKCFELRLACVMWITRLLLLLLLFGISSIGESSSENGDTGPPQEKKLKTSCYFDRERKTALESNSRDARHKVSPTCDNSLIPMADLAENHDLMLYGAPHELALVLSRGEGLFLDEYSDLDPWKDEVICQRHLNELSRQFFNNEFGHVGTVGSTGGGRVSACGYPEQHTAQGKRSMSFQMSKNFLYSHSTLVPTGIPICDRHYKSIPKQSITPRCSQSSVFNPNSQLSNPPHVSQGSAPDSQNTDVSMESNDEDYCPEERPDNEDPKRERMRGHLSGLLHEANIDRAFCKKAVGDLTPKNRQAKGRTVLKIFQTIVGLITNTVEEYSELMEMVMEFLAGKTLAEDNALLHSMMSALRHNFERQTSYSERIQLLSIFAYDVDYRDVTKYLPHLPYRMWKEAKKKAQSPVKNKPDLQKRERFDRVKIELFISFITSGHVMVNIPWGEQKTKDSDGNVILLPNTIRLTGIYETISMYEAWAKEYGHEPLSNSTTYKILSRLPALKSSSKTCAFLRIQEILRDLNSMNYLDTAETAEYKKAFDEFQTYLRTDFKLRIKEESRIADHCWVHSLSDPDDKRFAAPPSTTHKHDRKCPTCEKMDFVFSELGKKIAGWAASPGTGDPDVEYKLLDLNEDFRISADKVLDYKAHIVRSVFTSNERDIFIRELKEGEAFITMDFAQRWLPSYFRETQKDFFGKNGYSWHISHVYANISGELVQHTFVHIFKNEMQNGSVVVEVVKHMAEDLATMGVTKIHLRSDNAGYYHSAAVIATIPDIEREFSVKFATWSFSESQSGKSSSDRYASYCKTIMRAYMATCHDIDTHEKMFEALTSGKGLRGMSVHLGTVGFTPQPKTKLDGISKLGHFQFDGDSIKAWRFRGIGAGMEVNGLKGIDSSVTWHKHGGKLSRVGLKDEDKKKIADGEEPHYWFFPNKKVDTPEPDNVDDEVVTGKAPEPQSESGPAPLFVCNECSASFIRHHNLVRHIEKGEHKIRPVKVTMYDYALGLYKRMLEEVQRAVGIGPLSETFKEYEVAPKTPRPMGWALRNRKKSAPYNAVAKKMVVDLFEEFYAAKNKLRAEEVERRMKERKDIKPAQRMKLDQIKNCIRTLLDQKKNGDKKKRPRRTPRDIALQKDFVNDWEKELIEEGAELEDEVQVHEDDRIISRDDIYDMIHEDKVQAELFDDAPDPSNTCRPEPTDIGYIDQ